MLAIVSIVSPPVFAGQFVQPVVTGTTPNGLQWSAVATGTALPFLTSLTSPLYRAPGPVVYFNIYNGQIQVDTNGLSLASITLTYTTGTTNITGTTPGPFQFLSGTGVESYSPITGTPRTFPAKNPSSGGLDPTTFSSRVGLTVGFSLSALLDVGPNPNSASTTGYWDTPWAFPSDLVISGSISSMVHTNFKTTGQGANLNANVLGFGSQESVFHFRVSNASGGPVGPVIPVGPGISISSGVQTQLDIGYRSIFGPTPVVKMGAGTLVLNQPNTLTGSTTVQGGRLRLAHATALPSSRIVPLVGGTLTLSGTLKTTVGGLDPNAGGLTDVGDGLITVAAGLSAADTLAAITKGRGTGSWFGTSGMTSTQAAADNASGFSRAVGWVENSNGSITVAYAAPGDTNLDWIVDILDISKFVSSGRYGTGRSAVWAEGDFNYDGVVDIQDVAEFSTAGLYGLGLYNDAPGPVAAVPEPTAYAMVLAGLVCGGFSMWRQKRA